MLLFFLTIVISQTSKSSKIIYFTSHKICIATWGFIWSNDQREYAAVSHSRFHWLLEQYSLLAMHIRVTYFCTLSFLLSNSVRLVTVRLDSFAKASVIFLNIYMSIFISCCNLNVLVFLMLTNKEINI